MSAVLADPLFPSHLAAGHAALGADYWGITRAADRRFKRILSNIVGLLLAMLVLLPFWVVAPPAPTAAKPAVNYALELLPTLSPKPLVEPAPVKPKLAPKQVSVSEPRKPKPVNIEQQKQDAAVAAAQRQAAAKAAAAKAGVMAFSQQLAQLRDSRDSALIAERNLRDRGAVVSEPEAPSKDRLSASKVSEGHGEVGARSVSAEQGSTAVGRHRTEKLAAVAARTTVRDDGAASGNVAPSRSLAEIQLAFDRSKTAFYSIFNRAARKDASIRAGTVVVSLTIQPNGTVSDCKIVSSSFFNEDLKQKLLHRVSMLKFEAKSVPAFTYPNYPISYIP